MHELLTPEQCSQKIGVPTATLAVWRCRQNVRLKYVKIGRHVRYRLSDIESFVSENVHGASEAAQ
jgi:Helix-turn-helix domain